MKSSLALATVLALSAAADIPSVDFSNRIGTIRPSLHGASYMAAFADPSAEPADAWIRDLNMSFCRTHDWGMISDGHRIIDTHYIFPVETADVDDPNSYYFKASDEAIRLTMEKTGSEILFRLGNSIDKSDCHYNSRPPKDALRYAKVCEKIIRHYNEGWNDGYHLGIRYWELWNEPDLASRSCWTGTEDEFVNFFSTVISYLQKAFPKSQYPDIRIGGPALANFSIPYLWKLTQQCEAKGALPDFLSWHNYGTDVAKVTSRSRVLRNFLREKGARYARIGTIIDEWHYVSNWNDSSDRNTVDSAAYTAACHCGFQNEADSNKYEVACFYGLKLNGSWGITTTDGKRHAVYYAMKMVGDVMTSCTDCCKTTAGGYVHLLAGRSADGRTGKLLVSYYAKKGADTSVSIRMDAANSAMPKVARVERIAGNAAEPSACTDWTIEDGVLTLPKPRGSAVFLVTFDIPATKEN